MLVFLDDSGDPGFKLDKGSSLFFVIAMVIFDDELEAEKTALAIKELKRSLGFPDREEFKSHKSKDAVREAFLKAVDPFNYTIRCLVVDKQVIRSKELRTNRNSFYAYFIKEVLKHNGGQITDAKVRIDGGGDRVFRKNFLSYLRRELNQNGAGVMKNCKLVDSKHDALVQMADMIAGSINRAYADSKPNAQLYMKIIRSKITNIWNFR